ncbi:hypothetical protein D3C87_1644670 [compost metagenome]
MHYEKPDGSPYRFDHDFFHKLRPEKNVTPGPFEIFGNSLVKMPEAQICRSDCSATLELHVGFTF